MIPEAFPVYKLSSGDAGEQIDFCDSSVLEDRYVNYTPVSHALPQIPPFPFGTRGEGASQAQRTNTNHVSEVADGTAEDALGTAVAPARAAGLGKHSDCSVGADQPVFAPPGCLVVSNSDAVELPSSYPPLAVTGFRPCRSGSLAGCRLTLATDFSGPETPSMALRELGADVELVSVSEQQTHLRAFIRLNFEPGNVFASAGARTSYRTDLYVAGPPCIKFSALGSRAGEPDPENSTFELSIAHIELAKPVVFVLENVCGMLSYKQGSFFRSVLARLECDGCYAVRWAVYDARHCGVAQSRKRVYIVGVTCGCCNGAFDMPAEPMLPTTLEDFLGARTAGESSRRRPPSTQVNASRNLSVEIARLRLEGLDPAVPDRVLDIDASSRFTSKSGLISPCLTHSRAQGLWLIARGRRMSPAEAIAVQGIDVRSYRWSMKPNQVRAAAGNAMCLPVLALILETVVPFVTAPSSTLPRHPDALGPCDALDDGCIDELPVQNACPAWAALGSIGRIALDRRGPFSGHLAELFTKPDGRARDMFPLPAPVDLVNLGIGDVDACDVGSALAFAQALVMVLNYGYGVRGPDPGVARGATVAQRTCLLTLGARIRMFVDRLRADVPGDLSSEAAGARAQARGTQTPLRLVADLAEYPSVAGTCDPLSVVPRDVAEHISSADSMFPNPPIGLENFAGFYAGERAEYVKHAVNLLRCGKVGLRSDVRGGGTVFPVLKPDGVHQRKVWHGTRVSQACVRPPCPRLLASPSAFYALELGRDELLRVSKRDGRCFFDQLRLPADLEPFMGRPDLSVGELLSTGMTIDELRTYCRGFTLGDGDVAPDSKVSPCSRVLGMGFAWSSFVSQETMLGVCHRVGLTSDRALAFGVPAPDDGTVFFSVATDDVMIFSSAGPGYSSGRAALLDAEFVRAGIVKHEGKDENDEVNSKFVGVQLVDGAWWWPPADKIWNVLLIATSFCASRRGSSGALKAFVGSVGWFDLLNRAKLASYSAIYRESLDYDDWTCRVSQLTPFAKSHAL